MNLCGAPEEIIHLVDNIKKVKLNFKGDVFIFYYYYIIFLGRRTIFIPLENIPNNLTTYSCNNKLSNKWK